VARLGELENASTSSNLSSGKQLPNHQYIKANSAQGVIDPRQNIAADCSAFVLAAGCYSKIQLLRLTARTNSSIVKLQKPKGEKQEQSI